MPQSLTKISVHIVFSTKDRRPLLADDELRREMHQQLGGTSRTLGCPPLIVGGVADHIHLLGQMSRTIAIAEWIKELKRVSSIWIKERDPRQNTFQWQSGYGAFSVGQSEIERVADYIRNQAEHHRQRGFKDEFRLLMARYKIEIDERYVWD